jgi:hypothetical protein
MEVRLTTAVGQNRRCRSLAVAPGSPLKAAAVVARGGFRVGPPAPSPCGPTYSLI